MLMSGEWCKLQLCSPVMANVQVTGQRESKQKDKPSYWRASQETRNYGVLAKPSL
jgi:hypothetical protein